MIKIRKMVVLSIIFLMVFVFIPKKYEIQAKKKEIKSYKYEDIKKNENIVFLGDSITDWYPIDDIFGDLPIVKSGIAGYETHDLLDRMDSMVYQYNPTKVFILIGTNDLKRDEEKNEETAKNIIKIIKEIKENRSKAEIYYEAIYPVNRSLGAAEERYNSEIKEVNKIVKEYCDKNNVTYIDMYALLEDSKGNFNKSYTDDGLHPNNLGYSRISSELLKYIYGAD